MTNSKSVDNYGFMPAKPFVMNNRTYCLIDGIQFVIYTIAPDLLSQSGERRWLLVPLCTSSHQTVHQDRPKGTIWMGCRRNHHCALPDESPAPLLPASHITAAVSDIQEQLNTTSAHINQLQQLIR